MIKKLTKGFTLIELLLYMGILGLLLAVLTSIFSSVLNVQLESESVSSVQQDGRFIISRLTYDMQRASSLSLPASLGQSGSSAALVIGGVTNTYAADGNGNITVTNNLGTINLNSYTTRVSGLTFTRLGNAGGKNSLQVSFTLTSNVVDQAGAAEVKSFQTMMNLR